MKKLFYLTLVCLLALTTTVQANDYLEQQGHYTVMSMGNGVYRFYIPIWVYEAGILVLLAGLVICLSTCGIRKGLRYSLGLLLIEYVLLIYCSTVFFRNTGKLQYDFMPFWSYRDYFNGVDKGLLAENIMNMVVFVPAGLLAGAAFRSMSWKKVMVIGM